MQLNRVIAIVIGQGGYNDIGLVRSCGEAGMNVILVIPEITVIPLHKSKYVIECIRCRVSEKNKLIGLVYGIAEKYSNYKLVMFPASDLCACLIDEAWKELSEYAIVPHAQGRIRELMDKYNMSKIAEECHLVVPRTNKENLKINLHPEFKLPCIIKPLMSISGEKGDISICHRRDEYEKILRMYYDKGFYEILIQELICGNNQEEVAVTGVCTPTRDVITHGIIHKIRTRGNGSTVFARFRTEIDQCLQQKVKYFIKATGYIGIFDIEFLYNDSGYHFIECNFRNGAYGYAVTSAGFNMPQVFAGYLDRTSLPLESKIKDITFMEERSDILNVFDGTITPIQWIKNVLSTDTFLWWNWRDPAPMIRMPYFVKRFFRR